MGGQMRKLVVFNLVTLDGYVAGPNGEIDWHRVDGEFNDFAIEQTATFGALLFGRVTYQLMASYWPTAEALQNDPQVARQMNSIPKVVVSRTLETADWHNTRLVKENVAEEIQKLKAEEGKEIAIFGSSNLCAYLLDEGLIDEVRLIYNPVVLGNGMPIFKGTQKPVTLDLFKSRTFGNGNVLHYYRVADKA
jgi:dihydrofolate reductase